MNRLRLLALLLILGIVAAALWLDGEGFLSVHFIQTRHADLQAHVDANVFTASLAFFLIYTGLISLSVPGAALILALAGGALFGVLWGTVLASFASSIGSAIGCLLARFLLRGFIERAFPSAVQRINAGIRDDGAYYLFGLRLVPLFPFFIINTAIGLTRLPLRTFYWVSQLGMLPGTVVVVNAGTQLAGIEGAGDILSPVVAGSLALLGVFPLVAKKAADALMNWHRRRETPP